MARNRDANRGTTLRGDKSICWPIRTKPEVMFFTPPDELGNYGSTYIARIDEVLRRGGFGTYDLS